MADIRTGTRSAIALAADEGTRSAVTKYRPKPVQSRRGNRFRNTSSIDARIEERGVVGYRRQRVRSRFGAAYRNVPLTYGIRAYVSGSIVGYAEGFSAGELKHGPLALVTERTPVFALVTEPSNTDEMIGNIREVGSRGAPVIAVTDAPELVEQHVA